MQWLGDMFQNCRIPAGMGEDEKKKEGRKKSLWGGMTGRLCGFQEKPWRGWQVEKYEVRVWL